MFNEIVQISIIISPKYSPEDPFDNKSTYVQVMAWHRTDDKPLPETMMAQFNDAYVRHLASVCFNSLRPSDAYTRR